MTSEVLFFFLSQKRRQDRRCSCDEEGASFSNTEVLACHRRYRGVIYLTIDELMGSLQVHEQRTQKNASTSTVEQSKSGLWLKMKMEVAAVHVVVVVVATFRMCSVLKRYGHYAADC